MFDAVAKLLFQACILRVTQKGAPAHLIGVAIRTTLVFIHIVCINVTGLSVGPTQSIGPALVGIGGNAEAVLQLWLLIVAATGASGLILQPGPPSAEKDLKSGRHGRSGPAVIRMD
tara:strand:+ start:2204 stop:2551 length:348 start_codon:yes stop_codon:yes gene_type:complete